MKKARINSNKKIVDEKGSLVVIFYMLDNSIFRGLHNRRLKEPESMRGKAELKEILNKEKTKLNKGAVCALAYFIICG